MAVYNFKKIGIGTIIDTDYKDAQPVVVVNGDDVHFKAADLGGKTCAIEVSCESGTIEYWFNLATDTITGPLGAPYATVEDFFVALSPFFPFFQDAENPWVSGTLPNYTNAQRDALINVPLGAKIFNVDSDEEQTKVSTGWLCCDKCQVVAGSNDTISISDDPDNPSFITGIILSDRTHGIELVDGTTGTFKNVKGRAIKGMNGTISFTPRESGAGDGVLRIVSERSTDGVNWIANPYLLRTVSVPQGQTSYRTLVSAISDLQDGEMFRFRLFETGSGGVDLVPELIVGLGGQTLYSVSFSFLISEETTIIPD